MPPPKREIRLSHVIMTLLWLTYIPPEIRHPEKQVVITVRPQKNSLSTPKICNITFQDFLYKMIILLVGWLVITEGKNHQPKVSQLS